MDYHTTNSLQQFKTHIGIPFQLYNSLFTSLPFHRIEKTGILLSLFLENCSEGFEQKLTPVEIIDQFFEKHTSYKTSKEKLDLLFRFVQYVERQVVLFDALEDASFKQVNDVNGAGTFKYLESELNRQKAYPQLEEKLKDFSVRIVLTAHPTQFYPGPVLGIINDLSRALKKNKAGKVNMYLQQLGKTAFLNKKKPTPYDEAISLIWFLEHVFYSATGKMLGFLKNSFPDAIAEKNPGISLGFWPGGDRDGNPNVNTAVTLQVSEALRSSIIKCYARDVRTIKRRLTFKGIDTILAELEAKLHQHIFAVGANEFLESNDILSSLKEVRQIVQKKHNGLFISLVDDLIGKVQAFGLYFASLDIRQDSSVHSKLLEEIACRERVLRVDYASVSEEEKINILSGISGSAEFSLYEGVLKDTLHSMQAIKTIQQKNGEAGCHRYVISQCNSALSVMEVFGLLLLSGWKKGSLTVDIIPLFETIDDLERAGSIMQTVFSNEVYRKHLQLRNNNQTIMVGFSDGTKDGGYLMANWGIYHAKKKLTKIGRDNGIDIIFFDGRGGPPARGGGKTHKFYASMGKEISNKEIQLTIQGQTISANFGNRDAAQFNMEQLMTAGITNELFPITAKPLNDTDENLIRDIATSSMEKYLVLRNHPQLADYLLNATPIKYYSETNIGSRPANRNASGSFDLKQLRAIPFVGAWSQVKQNVTGYYGVGTALQQVEKNGQWESLQILYKNSLFIKTLFDNCEMSMKKCFFPLTAGLATDQAFSAIWNDIHNEYELTKKYVLKLGGHKKLMEDYPVEDMSVSMREKIVLPILTIQQYALAQLRILQDSDDTGLKNIFEKLIIRCSFGIINAGRNAA